ncbi:LANO_0C04170g1_1 [Lachancea nothofagi CBS 11611]|uniref:LANO_0C04170g1_1 n=1 Tax=Lachancea nothofagi CBS 11611 TaxID=1266666 RepID=A0A1G4J6D9_9SACH|nr:LANO_0C04170g1_1 [Lachancea nothofagi CBS 11611]
MSVALVRFTYELIFSALPIKSGNGGFAEVESESVFGNCRLLLINVATTYNIDSVAEESMRLIELITKQQKTTSLSEKSLSSLIVLLRLLSDIAETCWKQEEAQETSQTSEKLGKEEMASANDAGFSTQKLCFHVARPKALESAISQRLVRTISRLKFSFGTMRALRKLSSSHYTNQTAPASSGKGEGPHAADYEQSTLLKIMDTNLEYLSRFSSAANPIEYLEFINSSIINPLVVTHTCNDSDVVPYLDMFSSFYITSTNLPKFLQNISKVLDNLKKNTYQELMLMFTSQAIMTWILSRPHEYVLVINEIKAGSKDDVVHAICKYSSSLFDEIYSSFNVSYLLTTTATSNAAISEFKSSPPSSDVSSPISSSGSTSYFQPDNADLRRSYTSPRQDFDSQGYPVSWDFLNSSALSGILFQAEDVANLSVLRFLVVMLLFQPSTFEEMNFMSFKHIPDEVNARPEEPISRVNTDEEKKKPQSQLSKLRQSNHRKLQTLKFPSFTSSSKKIKFLTTLIKNINGSQVVSDTSLLDTLRTIVLMFRAASSIHLADEESLVVSFCKRMLFVVGDLLQLCDYSQSKKNPVIARCLSRNPTSHTKLQIAFFAPALIIAPNSFITRLNQFTQNKHTGFKHLRTLTEGFKLFFSIPNVPKTSLETVLKSTEFFRNTLAEMSDVIISASLYFSDDISSIVEGVLNGSLKSGADVSKVGRSLSPSFPSKPLHPPISQDSNIKPDAGSTASSSSASSEGSSYNEKSGVQKGASERTEILAPRARRSSGSSVLAASKMSSKLSYSSEGEKSVQGVRTQLENMHKGVKSPLRFSRSREPSDGNLPALNTQLNNQRSVVENSVLFTHNTNYTELADARATLVNIMSIYKRMVHYYFISLGESGLTKVIEDYNLLIKPLFVGLVDDQPVVQKTSKSFASAIATYALDRENEAYSSDIRLILYKGAVYLVTLISATLFNLNLDDTKREQLLEVVVTFLDVRLELKSGFDLGILRDIEKDTFQLLHGATGRALLASLYSHEPRIHKLLRACFKSFLRELDSHDKIMGQPHEAERYNKSFFRSMCKDSYVSTGAVAFQRRLRSDILKYVEFPDRMLLDTLKLMYNQWLVFMRRPHLSSMEANHFRNIAGIIASSCGTFLTIDKDMITENPAFASTQNEVVEMIDYFLSIQCSWLNDPDLLTRENSKDIVSTELHPLGFKLLFEHLKLKADALEALDLTETQYNSSVLLLEQIILILRTILEREDAKQELILVSLQLLSLIGQLFKIVENVSHSSTRYYKAIIHLSKMLKSFEGAEKTLCVSGYLLIKNQWLRLAISWFKSALFKEFDLENLARPHREMDLNRRDLDYLYIDTSIESSRALAYISKDLMLEVPMSISESELKRSKAVTFGNYFSILLKGLEKTSSVEKYPSTLRHKIGVLNDNIINCLTNLLNANVDVGLRYALPIGYSNNQSIKLAFLKVFVEIISNFDIQTAERIVKKNELIESYVTESLKIPYLIPLAARVCPANDIDALASSMLTICEVKNASHVIVVELIKEEIQSASRYADVLRRNSCATRTLSMFSRLKGSKYLTETLRPVLSSIIDNDDGFEIEKISPDHPDAEKNVQLFTKYLEMLINSIVNSIPSFPAKFFLICQSIYLSVREKFPGYETVAVGSFIFLRFFCPALVSPDSENIVDIVSPKQKRAFVILAKVIQNIANGSINSMKWPLLISKASFLQKCSERVSLFLSEIGRPDRVVDLKLHMERKVTLNEFNYFHKYLYQHGLEVRNESILRIRSTEDFETLKRISKATDVLLWTLGQPRMEFRSEIPSYVRDKMDENPELYDFMSRHSLRTFDFKDDIPFIHEAVSSDGLPIVVLTYKMLKKQTCDSEALIYRTFQVYSKVWSSKHYFVVDCTGIEPLAADDKKVVTFFFNLVPDEVARNCAKFYYLNMTEQIIAWWLPIFKGHNPYLRPHKTPHEFINSNTSPNVIKSLKLDSCSNEVFSDVRVTLHGVSLYDPQKGRFTPVTLKIGNKYVQMISETPYRFKVSGIDNVVEINFNNVYEVGRIASTVVSFETGVPSEFTINFDDGTNLVLCSSKYLEIIKIFYYAQARIEEEYDNANYENPKQTQVYQNEDKEHNDILGSLILVVYAGFCSNDEDVKNISYNVLAATQDSFGLDFGCKLRVSPEVHVPHDTSAFCDSLLKGLARTAPELSLVVWKSILEGLSGIFEVNHIPHVISTLTPWAANLYKHVYLADDEKGPENVSFIIRTLIKLSVEDTRLLMIYSQCIWSTLILEADLIALIVDEVVNHSIDRESEGAEWKNAISLLTRVSTVEMCSEVVNRILRVSRSFLPSLKMEASTNSWSELIILVNITVALFFDSLLLSQLFLPEVLYIVSLLIDVGPSEMRLALHKLLVNVCQSLSTNEALTVGKRETLDMVKETLSRQKMRFMSGFSQDKGRILQSFSASSFLSKFTTLEHFVGNIILLMENSSDTDGLQWKAKYNKYIMDSVFNLDSFLSARAAMIIGIIGQAGMSEFLCKNMLMQTIKIVAEPHINDELIFFVISHSFTYSKIVLGLQPKSPLLKKLFWLSTTFAQSPNTIFYHGGLLFMANAVRRISSVDRTVNKESLSSILFGSRAFAEPLFIELEAMVGLKWTKENLPHIVLSLVSKGMLVPYVKTTAVECLTLFLTLAHNDLAYAPSDDYLCYLLFVYQVSRPSKLETILSELDIDDELVYFDEQNFVTRNLLRWMESDSETSLIALYQASVYFASGSSDELSKTRYLLLLNHLVKTNPMKVIRIYSVVRTELKRISTLDIQSDFPQLVFSIAQNIVMEKEYTFCETHLAQTNKFLKSRYLSGIQNIEFPYSSNDSMAGVRVNPYTYYERKKLTVKILSRMIGPQGDQ